MFKRFRFDELKKKKKNIYRYRRFVGLSWRIGSSARHKPPETRKIVRWDIPRTSMCETRFACFISRRKRDDGARPRARAPFSNLTADRQPAAAPAVFGRLTKFKRDCTLRRRGLSAPRQKRFKSLIYRAARPELNNITSAGIII